MREELGQTRKVIEARINTATGYLKEMACTIQETQAKKHADTQAITAIAN